MMLRIRMTGKYILGERGEEEAPGIKCISLLVGCTLAGVVMRRKMDFYTKSLEEEGIGTETVV